MGTLATIMDFNVIKLSFIGNGRHFSSHGSGCPASGDTLQRVLNRGGKRMKKFIVLVLSLVLMTGALVGCLEIVSKVRPRP